MIPSLKNTRAIESVRIAIGEKGEKGKKLPTKLSHFIFTTTQKRDKRYMRDEQLSELFGDKPKKIPILLLSDDIEVVMPTFYAKYAQSGIKLRSDDALHWTMYNDDGTRTLVECDPDDCKYLKDKDVKPHAILTGVVDCDSADRDKHLGEKLFKFRTTSWNTMHALLYEMNRIKDACGGHLAYLPLNLIVFPKMVRPKGQSGEVLAYIVSLEPRTTMADLRLNAATNAESLAAITHHTGALEQAASRISDYEEETVEEQIDVHDEFHPDASMVPPLPKTPKKKPSKKPAPKSDTPVEKDATEVTGLPKDKAMLPLVFPDELSEYNISDEYRINIKQLDAAGTYFDVNNTKVWTNRNGLYYSSMIGFSMTYGRVPTDIVDAVLRFGIDKVKALHKKVDFMPYGDE